MAEWQSGPYNYNLPEHAPVMCWCRPGAPELPVRSPHEKNERCSVMHTRDDAAGGGGQ